MRIGYVISKRSTISVGYLAGQSAKDDLLKELSYCTESRVSFTTIVEDSPRLKSYLSYYGGRYFRSEAYTQRQADIIVLHKLGLPEATLPFIRSTRAR